MLRQVADGVWVHQSEFMQTNSVVVRGSTGVLLIDPGVTSEEVECLAADLRELSLTVVAGFSTHPHWDHLLWHARFGAVPRHATRECAAATAAWLSTPGVAAGLARAGLIPPELDGRLPLDRLGDITGLPVGVTTIPWDGPAVEIIEHRAHARGHAALVIESRGVLVGADVLSDMLIPMLDSSAADPVGDYVVALDRIEAATAGVDVLIPGHGSVAHGSEIAGRIAQDRAYLHALQGGGGADDPRLGPDADGGNWLPAVHARQVGSQTPG